MVWRATDPQGNEAHKVRYDIIPYLGNTCLDIGCGPDKVFPHFIGLDSGKDIALFGIAMKPDIVGDCQRISLFADGAFDTVFSSHTLEHIEDYQAALAEWWRLVAPGGHLIVYLPHRDLYPRIGTEHANPDHKHDFAPDDIISAMGKACHCGDWDLVVNETRDQLREYSFLQVYQKLGSDDGTCVHSWEWRAKPKKSAAVVRLGAYGDALWASSLLPHLKAEGYHVTVYTEKSGHEVLAADPHIDRIIELPHQLLDDNDLILYFVWEARKYSRFINLTGSVETRLLPHPNEPAYYWPHDARHREMNRNYLEAMHDLAGLPHEFHQRFYPTPDEHAWALAERAQMSGQMVVVAPTGSSLPKTWPHVQAFMDILAARGVHTVVLGEIRQPLTPPAGFGHIAGKNLPIRLAMALAQVADAVVGTESAIINAVAMEGNLKVALLSHSSAENLTKHWRNTLSVEPTNLACYPCHRLHRAFEFCVREPQSGFAACQAAATADVIAEAVLRYLKPAAAA
jgi:ADP-heptose:LPS heptosyltransferase